MAISKIILNGITQIDLTEDTVTQAEHIMAPYTGHLASGLRVTGTGQGGGDSGYTLTTIVPQQTITPASSDGTYKADLSYLVNLEEGADYIVTINGAEYWTTCVLMWGTSYLLGDINHFWSSDEQPYPFGIINEDNAMTMATSSGGARTVKVEKIELTGSGGGGDSATLITKSITANGTYSTSDDSADGYSEVTVNVPSSGSSAWTKVAETSYQVSTTQTSAATVATWATGHSEIWTPDKIVYVRIRDTAGKRAGYFYGSDTFFMNCAAKNNPKLSGASEYIGSLRNTWACNSSGVYTCRYGYLSTGYGVYPDSFYDDGRISICKRYHNSYSLTINGTYKVEVYLLDPPTGAPIFE